MTIPPVHLRIPVFRQRYLGTQSRRLAAYGRHANPNAGHRALAELERTGRGDRRDHPRIVDLLHTKAGSTNIVKPATATYRAGGLPELRPHHEPGRNWPNNSRRSTRDSSKRAESRRRIGRGAPTPDAVVAETTSFRYLDCPRCAGMLKPDIVYFGESVPKDIVPQAFSLVGPGPTRCWSRVRR